MSMIGNYLRIRPEELSRLRANPSTIMTLLYPEDNSPHPEGRHLDIDKSWQAIQFLLTGDPWQGEPPLSNAVMGGMELGDDDVGYGPARYLEPEQVRELAGALEGISGDELWSRFDASAFVKAEIYPEGLTEDDKEYILSYYRGLVQFVRLAANGGDALLLYLN